MQSVGGFISDVEKNLAAHLEDVKSSGLEGVMQWDFREDGNGEFHVIFARGKAEVSLGGHQKPTFTVAAPYAYFAKMVAGEVSHDEAVHSGVLKVSGEVAFGESFSKFYRSLL